jgi:hypothetical protein
MKHLKPILTLATALVFAVACDATPSAPEAPTETAAEARGTAEPLEGSYDFDGPVFDIAALPDGGILVADFATVKEIRRSGVREVITLPMVQGAGAFGAEESTFINGLQPIGNGNFFATRSALDLAVGGALFRATRGNAGIVADIEAFTIGDWPEGDMGQMPAWKDLRCEPPGGFSAGPQTNPYHLTALSGSEVLIADAAGNSLLWAKTNGQIEVVATFPPVVDPETGDRLVQFPLDEDTDCPVEPVPTAVAVGPDGAYYVGELTGTTADNFGGQPTPEGLASVWRIESGSRDVVCPSESCAKVITGLNSVIDLEFGPEGSLYVVEYERSGFLATVAPGFGIPLEGGTVKKCDVHDGNCEIIEGEVPGTLMLPGAVTFDRWGGLWLLDNVFAPTVRRVDSH